MKTFIALLAGGVVATTLVLACSDDSPGDADAATCDCPASEPPIANRAMKVRGSDVTLAQDSGNNARAECPTGAIVLGGECHVLDDGGGGARVVLRQFGSDATNPQAWICNWTNGPEFPTTAYAEVRCLMPAQ